MTKPNIFEKAKNFVKIIAVGDVHGKTNELGFRIKERYKISDSIIILCGDIELFRIKIFELKRIILSQISYFLKRILVKVATNPAPQVLMFEHIH